MTRSYPDETTGGFPRPPREILDGEGRTITLCHATELEALVEMYVEFDPSDRAQGIPPLGESTIREWLENVTGADAVNLVARHDGRVVGHAMLVGTEEYELAIFVLQAYQNAGIGTELLRTTLGTAADTGIERVWLSVERWNDPAIALYQRVGFEHVDNDSFELEMTLRLDTSE
jgi:GNAT superfamily N-acetyltransferase